MSWWACSSMRGCPVCCWRDPWAQARASRCSRWWSGHGQADGGCTQRLDAGAQVGHGGGGRHGLRSGTAPLPLGACRGEERLPATPVAPVGDVLRLLGQPREDAAAVTLTAGWDACEMVSWPSNGREV